MNLTFLCIMNVTVVLNISVENVDRKLSNICKTSFCHLQKVQKN